MNQKVLRTLSVASIRMDSNVARNGRLIDIVDIQWREEKLPNEAIAVPAAELPDPEPDNSNPQETLREQEQKWTDLALNRIHRTVPTAHTS
ncbi:anaphase-promoting complex subunit 13 [Trichonephila inaurata madagascariensis]|uniref:Anaphase-promoting complex subunit 13 n=1 Tax=Trichonephila inaurata madagascariensis TaxID=2747483 RepID=A0A8X7CBR6_9ARAC|nr:anaphase-promoting complex subunit 13 [Trichonephila inaurata madagascariensis]